MYLFFPSSSIRLSLSIAWVNICNADNNNNINRKIDAHIQRTHTTNYLNENWNVKIDDGMEQKIYISTEIKNKKLVYSHWVRANTRRTKRHCAFHFAFFFAMWFRSFSLQFSTDFKLIKFGLFTNSYRVDFLFGFRKPDDDDDWRPRSSINRRCKRINRTRQGKSERERSQHYYYYYLCLKFTFDSSQRAKRRRCFDYKLVQLGEKVMRVCTPFTPIQRSTISQ